MPTHVASLLRLLYRLAAGREAVLPGADLLQRYLNQRDEAAFAALPKILGVCHDPLDAFLCILPPIALLLNSIPPSAMCKPTISATVTPCSLCNKLQ
jgi:hypothetical protein